MTFDEWWEAERVGEAFEAGYQQGHKEGYTYRETVYASQEGGI